QLVQAVNAYNEPQEPKCGANPQESIFEGDSVSSNIVKVMMRKHLDPDTSRIRFFGVQSLQICQPIIPVVYPDGTTECGSHESNVYTESDNAQHKLDKFRAISIGNERQGYSVED